MTDFSRAWSMPNADTFSIPPIGAFVKKYLSNSHLSIDPFARNYEGATLTNDMNPKTKAKYHMDAIDFLLGIGKTPIKADLIIFDPPYSNRQISECYANIGRKATMEDTQSSFFTKLRDALHPLVSPGGIVLSFGWNSVGMGITRGYELLEVLLVCHGGAHNDTICIAERRI